MGKYSVPENIRKFKPKGTMVKLISGNYYVYEYKMIKGDDCKRHTKMGSLIGTIKEGIGFIPNNSFVCDTEISTLDNQRTCFHYACQCTDIQRNERSCKGY
ncbi:MAG: hypothetical protein Q4D76_13025 [Oscillospiraceae bacterium]|nr:hypothetical protein [Oscillospiraceae bacterium]